MLLGLGNGMKALGEDVKGLLGNALVATARYLAKEKTEQVGPFTTMFISTDNDKKWRAMQVSALKEFSTLLARPDLQIYMRILSEKISKVVFTHGLHKSDLIFGKTQVIVYCEGRTTNWLYLAYTMLNNALSTNCHCLCETGIADDRTRRENLLRDFLNMVPGGAEFREWQEGGRC